MRLRGSQENYGPHGTLSCAETEIIRVIRSPDDFTISIQHRDGRFVVSRNTGQPGGPSIGGGDTFDEAWEAAGPIRS